jgi:hypothetical protein
MNQTTFANHWLYLRFLCLAYFRLFNGCDAKTGAERQNGVSHNGTASNKDNVSQSALTLA